jgi:protoheme IX farnesyltransferase
VTPESLILFLIIFCWTPPHFWALALYRRKEYEKVGMPMLPVTHGEKYTRLQIVLYTIILVIVTMMPFSVGMAGLIYIIFASLLNAYFLFYTVMLYREYSDKLSMKIFRYSIWYLGLIFLAFLIDHYFKFKFI